MPKPKGCGPKSSSICIRQIPSTHVITDIYHFGHSNKTLPNLKTTAHLLYTTRFSSACLMALRPAIRPISSKRMGPVICHNEGETI